MLRTECYDFEMISNHGRDRDSGGRLHGNAIKTSLLLSRKAEK